ncbi:MAG: hypothetical protein K0S63_221 [Gammaproteobacteria bacterium]|jgi:translocation and assembly module TamB|nr:hypothetical protein [Gammaproteobacteria bacterium]
MTLKHALNIFLLLILLCLSAILFIAVTPQGLRWSYHLLQKTLPGELTVKNLQGRLIGPLQFEELNFYSDKIQVDIKQGFINWRLRHLLLGRFVVAKAQAESIDLFIAEKQSDSPAFDWQSLSIPLNFTFKTISVENLRIQTGEQKPILVQHILLQARTEYKALFLEKLQAEYEQKTFHLKGQIEPKPFAGNLELLISKDEQTKLHFKTAFSQTVEQLNVDTQFLAPIRATSPMTIHNWLHKNWHIETQLHSALIEGKWTAKAELQGYSAKGVLNSHSGFLEFSHSAKKTKEAWHFALASHWKNIAWPSKEDPLYASPQGNLSFEGNLDHYQFFLKTALLGKAIPESQWTIVGEGDNNTIILKKINAALLQGNIQGSAKATFSPHVNWQVNLQANQLDFGKQWIDWPSKMSFLFSSKGNAADQHINSTHKIENLTGTWLKQKISGALSLAMKDTQLQSMNIDLAINHSIIKIAGTLNPFYNLHWRIDIPNLEPITHLATGAIQSTGKITGSFEAPQMSLDLNAKEISYDQYSVSSIIAKGDMDFVNAKSIKLSFLANKIQAHSYVLEQLNLLINGNLQKNTTTLFAQHSKATLATTLVGTYSANQWQGQLTQLNFNPPESAAWSLEKAAPLVFSSTMLNLKNFCWLAPQQKICAEVSWQKDGPWKNNFNIENVDLKQFNSLFDFPIAIAARLNAHGQYSYTPTQGILGSSSINMGSGHLNYTDSINDVEQLYPFESGQFNSQFTPAGFASDLQFKFDRNKYIKATLKLPGFHGQGSLSPQQAITGNAELYFTDLSWLSLFLSEFSDIQGNLQAKANWRGTVEKPILQSNLTLKNGKLIVWRNNTDIKNINFTAQSTGADKIEYSGKATLGEGQLNLQGSTRFNKLSPETVLKIKGNDLLVLNKKEMKLVASPDLVLKLQPEFMELTGKIIVPSANIVMPQYSGTATLPAETIFLNQPDYKEPSWSRYFYANVTLNLGKNVAFNIGKISGKINGILNVNDAPQKPTTAKGELNVTEGEYTDFGRTFNITRASLIYAGGTLNNPGLNITATRQVNLAPMHVNAPGVGGAPIIQPVLQDNKITVGLRVTGTLMVPKITLFSDPPGLPESDILSYLILGYPVQQATSDDSKGTLFQALSSLETGGGSNIQGLKKGFQDATGLDVLNVETAAFVNPATQQLQNVTSVVLGKTLSPRLFVGYSVGVFEALNTVTMRYKITDSVSVQTQSNNFGTGADLLYGFQSG